jgi:hypothetical protein
VKKLWKFHHFFQWKMSEKQTTFLTVNCAGKFESANQWHAPHGYTPSNQRFMVAS